MKKILLIRSIVLGSALVFGASAYSQDSSERVASINKKPPSSQAEATAPDETSDKLALTEIKALNSKMFDDFSKRFKKASNIFVRSDGVNTNISCKIDGVTTKVQYNQKGKLAYSLRYFEESKLPSSIRRIVESGFPEYSIFGFVTELAKDNKKVHLVMIEDKTTWKRIRVINGEMDVYEEYSKPQQ
jgi:hypothetical protein